MIALHGRAACLRALYKQDHRSALQLYGDDDDRQDEEYVSLKYLKCKHSLVPKVPQQDNVSFALSSAHWIHCTMSSAHYYTMYRQDNVIVPGISIAPTPVLTM